MNRNQRNQNIEFIKLVRAGKRTPWEGQVISWFTDDDGNYIYNEHCIAPGKFSEFKKLVGGNHIVFQLDPESKPIGTVPAELIIDQSRPSIGQRIKKVVTDIFHVDQHPGQLIELRRQEVREKLRQRRLKQEQKVELPCSPEHCVAGWEPDRATHNWLVTSSKLINEINYNNGIQRYTRR